MYRLFCLILFSSLISLSVSGCDAQPSSAIATAKPLPERVVAPSLPARLAQQRSEKYIARIEVHTAEELDQLLNRAEQLFDSGGFESGKDAPIAFVLHGPEAKTLLKQNYQANKSLVDRVARLSAFNVVDVKVCRTWLGGESIGLDQLPPFIMTIPFGPAELDRLIEQEGYVYF